MYLRGLFRRLSVPLRDVPPVSQASQNFITFWSALRANSRAILENLNLILFNYTLVRLLTQLPTLVHPRSMPLLALCSTIPRYVVLVSHVMFSHMWVTDTARS
jgi:hypothetical protein